MYWLKGVLIGLIASAPLGPIGFVCLNYAITSGFRLAILAGLGAALADVLFASVSGFGLTDVLDWFQEYAFYTRSLGGLFLLGLGVHLLCTKPPETNAPDAKSKAEAFLSTFLFTLSNPITLVVFTTLICCMGARAVTWGDTLTLLLGVFSGAMLWWTTLSLIGSYTKDHIGSRTLHIMRKFTAYGVVLFGALAIVSAFFA